MWSHDHIPTADIPDVDTLQPCRDLYNALLNYSPSSPYWQMF